MTLKLSAEIPNLSSGVDSVSKVFEFHAHPIMSAFVETFRFTKIEEIPFGLEIDSEFVYYLLYKTSMRRNILKLWIVHFRKQ